ncbi:glycoside hydrolase [Echinicola soli]|uniref:Glycoside hydrolase n=1 Tax=Echinicola soli TaxID=2591634 RepID=A0A514CGJ2_9BACT|nr:glycosyl hydrolase [Echinicola soli]QDH78932.1 glycoside hydrolase [Echinicola soli]
MKLTLKLLIPAACMLAISCQAPSEEAANKPTITPNSWPAITNQSKPWTRWWWMGNAVDKENLNYLMHEYADAGLGGVEIAPIYGAKGHEDRYLEFLSDEWLEMLKYTINVSDSLDMQVDLTQGTGWPFGGPFVNPGHAASKLVTKEFDYSGQGTFSQDLTWEDEKRPELSPELIAVMAYGDNGQVEEITSQVSAQGQLNWQAEGNWKIMAIYNGKTGQKVKRAAPGGQGYTLDHFSTEAVNSYLDVFAKAFGEDIPGIRAFYNDSFEVYGANFTKSFLEEFQQRRGYDLKTYLPQLLGKENNEEVARIKSDYRQTLHELLLEHFTANWTAWAHSKGKKTKNQAHGSPGNLIDLYATVDIPECETFGSSYFPIPGLRRDSTDIRNVDPDPIMLKFASSAGHLAGKPLISCETFTWLGEHFKSSFSQMKPEVDQAFLAGINHVFYHGVTYSPKDIDFPGWLFYASLNLTQQNSLWPHFRSFNDYIARCQSVLQAGKPDNELIVYWPVYDVWAEEGNIFKMISVHHIDDWLHPTAFYEQTTELMKQGFALDFASDKLIRDAKVQEGKILTHGEASPAKALLIPKMEYFPVQTLEAAIQLAKEGATVIFEAVPEHVPGHFEVEKREKQLADAWNQLQFNDQGEAATGKGKVILNANVRQALESESIERESLADSGLQFIRRAVGNDKYYFLVNHTANTINKEITLNVRASSIFLMNPLTGESGLAKSHRQEGKTVVKVHLESGESLLLQASAAEATAAAPWVYRTKAAKTIPVKGPWKLHFNAGGPELPQDQTFETIQPWTAKGDDKADQFSGQATYSTTFDLQKAEGKHYLLKLGKVHESAKIWINGQEAGYAWSIPYQLRIGKFLKDGKNEIKIQIANLMANRIRYMDQKGLEWRNYHEINFVNINYKPFDASTWEVMPSGLEGPVELEVF